MTVREYSRTEFEVTLVAGASNIIVFTIDMLDAEGNVAEPFDGNDYLSYYAAACRVPQEDDRNPEPFLRFTVVHLPGFIPEGNIAPHPGAFMLLCDPTQSRILQDEWIQNGILDMFGVAADGQRDYCARANFDTEMVATRHFQ